MVVQDGGGDDDVLRRLVWAFGRAMPFEGGRNAHSSSQPGVRSVDFFGVNPHSETV